MSHLTLVERKRQYPLEDAWQDFYLSREAMLLSPGSLRLLRFTVGRFVEWLKAQEVTSPGQVTAGHVRAYLAGLKGRADSYVWTHASRVRSFLRFLHQDDYTMEPVSVATPRVAQKRQPVLSGEELQRVLGACLTAREKAIVLLLADTGLRRAEAWALRWRDVDLQSGLVRVERGKGGKARTVVVGMATRRALLRYRREAEHAPTDFLWQTKGGKRLTENGLRSVLLRIGGRAGIHLTPHMLRRTFAILSLRAGMGELHVQALLGHASLEMVRHYAQMADHDLSIAHRAHGPVDTFFTS